MVLRDLRRLAPVTTVVVLGLVDWFVFSSGVRPADLSAFLRGARAIRRGVTPYVRPDAPALWAGHAFVYPYATGWAFIPLAILPAATAKIVFFVISVAALALAWWLTAGAATRRGIALLVLTVGAEPVVRGLQLGTVNALLLLGLAVAWRWRDRGPVVVAALVTVVVAKLFLLPMVVWLIITGRRRPAVAVVAISATVILAGCWVGHTPITSYAHMLSVLSAHESPHSSSVEAAVASMGAGAGASVVVAWLLAAMVLAAGAHRTRRHGDERIAFTAVVVASLLASPIVWSHYFTLLAVIPLTFRWRPSYALTALVCSWLIGVPDEAEGLRVIHGFAGAGYVWASALAAGVVLAERMRSRRASPLSGQ